MNNTVNYLSERASKLTPYTAGIQPKDMGWIKLNTNENPYPPSPMVRQAIENAEFWRLKLYPDTEGGVLREAIAKTMGVKEENIFCGNGSDEVLALAFQAFFSGKNNVLTPDISYGFYPVWSEMYGVGASFIPTGSGFEIDPGGYSGGGGVVLANPNAPSGLVLGLQEIERITQNNPDGVVLIDEAYMDFADVGNAVRLTERYENLLVVRTFSKSYSLAGLRAGFAVGNAALISGLGRVKNAFNSYPLGLLPQIGAAAAISDTEYWDETRKKVMSTRELTAKRLFELGFGTGGSQANFLFVSPPKGFDAKGVYEHLLKNKILVRYWNKPRINNHLRVTVGTENEMEAFIECVKQMLNG